MTDFTPTNWRALCAELLLFAEQAGEIAANESLWPKCDPDCSMLARTAAALAQPEPQGPTDEQALADFAELRARVEALEAAATPPGLRPGVHTVVATQTAGGGPPVKAVEVPSNCRQRLEREGKAYPKSSCDACGTMSPAWRQSIQEAAKRAVESCLSQREEVLAAFIAKHGFYPEDAIQVEQRQEDGTSSWRIERRSAIEPVPVSERPILKSSPFNNSDGHCWCGTSDFIDEHGDRSVSYPASWELREPCSQDDCVLPHWALPVPQQEAE